MKNLRFIRMCFEEFEELNWRNGMEGRRVLLTASGLTGPVTALSG